MKAAGSNIKIVVCFFKKCEYKTHCFSTVTVESILRFVLCFSGSCALFSPQKK